MEKEGKSLVIKAKSEKMRKSVPMKECNVGDMSDRGEAKQGMGRSVLLSYKMIHLLRCVVAAGKEFVLPLGCLHPQSVSSQLAPRSAGGRFQFWCCKNVCF